MSARKTFTVHRGEDLGVVLHELVDALRAAGVRISVDREDEDSMEVSLPGPPETVGQKLAAGLSLIADAMVSASFYNSSGEDAVFELSRPLTEDEQRILKDLGFWNYDHHTRFRFGKGARANISFRQF